MILPVMVVCLCIDQQE